MGLDYGLSYQSVTSRNRLLRIYFLQPGGQLWQAARRVFGMICGAHVPEKGVAG